MFLGDGRHVPYVIATNLRVVYYTILRRYGNVTGAVTVHYRDAVTVEAIPSLDYRFVEWANDDEDLVIRTFAVNEDLALEAYFDEIDGDEE